MHTGVRPQRTEDPKQIPGGRIAFGAEHAHQARLRSPEQLAQPLEADGRIDTGDFLIRARDSWQRHRICTANLFLNVSTVL